MLENNENKKHNESYKGPYVGAFLFIVVLILNIGLYFYNSSLASNVESLNRELLELENSIKKMNNDEKIKIYTLVKANKPFLDKYKHMSRIPEFINNLKKLSRIYRISFRNFSYANSMISTQAYAIDDSISFGYQKSQKFISNFRDRVGTGTKSDDIFDLEFINSFEGQSEISFSVNFKIK